MKPTSEEQTLNIKKLSFSEFSDFRSSWNTLLQESCADPLFLSWEWMYHWWTLYGGNPDDELLVLAVFNAKEELVGIAPLYIQSRHLFNGALKVRRLQFIGSSCSSVQGFRTEHMQFIARREDETAVNTVLWDFIFQLRHYDECMFNDLVKASQTYATFIRREKSYNFLLRKQNASTTYDIDCRQEFSDYVTALGKNTRLKAFNRRKVLEQHGKVQLEFVTSEHIDKVFTPFAAFHQHRWGEISDKDKQQAFLKTLGEGQQIVTGGFLLTVEGKVVACTLDALCKNRAYNIQTGFIDGYDKKISLGTLVLGYATEKFCSDPQIDTYDLLAGTGKNANYKVRLANFGSELESIQVIRSAHLKFMYKTKDALLKLKKKLRSRKDDQR